MAYKIAFLLFSLALASNFRSSLQLDCQLPQGYDLTSLLKPDYWQFDMKGVCLNDPDPNSICHFYFTFCKTLPNSEDCNNSSVCQSSLSSKKTELGHYEQNPFQAKDANGFFVELQSGHTIINPKTQKPCNVSIKMEFDCNSSAKWPSDSQFAPAPTNYTGITGDSCEIYMKFDYAGACFHIVTPTTTTEFNPTPSQICGSLISYDVDTLSQPPYWSFNINSGCSILPNSNDKCTLNMAFCKPLVESEVIGCGGSSACIRYPNKGGSLLVGNFTPTPFVEKEFDGFFAIYPTGSVITNKFTNQTCNLSISMEFICDFDASWNDYDINRPGIGPEPLSFTSISATSCQINITVPYDGACSEIGPIAGLSGGSILLIIFFSILGVYLIVGVIYNKFVLKESGIMLLPHYMFWTTLLLYSLEGFIISWKFVTCKKDGGITKSTYDSI